MLWKQRIKLRTCKSNLKKLGTKLIWRRLFRPFVHSFVRSFVRSFEFRFFFRNFERPFTPRTKLGSARNFGKTRFRRFATFHFSTLKKILDQKILEVNFCFQETGVLEELGRFERHWHVRRKKLLPLMRFFLGRLPWRGGKWLNMCRKPRVGTESDFNHLIFFVANIFFGVEFCFQKGEVLEELWISKRYWHVRRKKLLPQLPLFLGRLPWRRGKRLNMCWKPRLGTENDFNHLDFFVQNFFWGRILFSKRWGFGGAVNFQALLARPS